MAQVSETSFVDKRQAKKLKMQFGLVEPQVALLAITAEQALGSYVQDS